MYTCNFLLKLSLITLLILGFSMGNSTAQYIEEFEDEVTSEWRTPTGDGQVDSELTINKSHGFARFTVDASRDQRNIWWAIMQTTISDSLNLGQISQPGYELRIEARIRASHAPRRVNLHMNTQRTTDFHTHLMEFDLPDTTNWHTISMTTDGFDGRPGDIINAHIALMDWGNQIFQLDVDYFKADVVQTATAEPDRGEQVIYPPPIPHPDEFDHSIQISEGAIIDRQYPDLNFMNWSVGGMPALTASTSKIILLRWIFDTFSDMEVDGYGMLQLTPIQSAQLSQSNLQEHDKIRLVEILDGDQNWNRKVITTNNFTRKKSLMDLLNSQMIIDITLPDVTHAPINIHIPRPVIQRLFNGITKGIALYPLGPAHVSFLSGTASEKKHLPTLFFNVME